jgi:type 1 fimbria pilin
MKRLLGLAMGVMCLAANVGAYASTPSGNLIVRGTITPAACNISLGGGGIIDYGTIRAADLSQTSFNPLSERTTSLTVTCGNTPAKFGLTVTDLQAGSKVAGILGTGYTEAQNYGLGAPGSRRTGGYSVTLRGLASSGTTLFPIVRASTGSAWQNGDGKVSQAPSQHSWRNTTTVAPASITQLSGVIAVRAVINRARDLDLTREVALDGRATLVLNYI